MLIKPTVLRRCRCRRLRRRCACLNSLLVWILSCLLFGKNFGWKFQGSNEEVFFQSFQTYNLTGGSKSVRDGAMMVQEDNKKGPFVQKK